MASSKLILASASPRRHELLGAMGMPFEVVAVDLVEHDGDSAPHFSPAELAQENARRKAEAVAEQHHGRWVLGADTVVALKGRLLGKPASLDEAKKFLQVLSGQTHEVITGCSLHDPDGKAEIFHETTRVTFRDLSDETVERYLESVHVLDKAGGYALQEHGDWIIEKVEGSRTNVVGLPTEALERVFKKRGWL